MTMARCARWLLAACLAAGACLPARAQEPVYLGSPGLPLSRMDAGGTLAEDWGTFRLALAGDGIAAPAAQPPAETLLEGVIPAGVCRSQHGPVALTLTAFRAPAWPAGVDVVGIRLEETAGKQANLTLALDLGTATKPAFGDRSVLLAGRCLVALPDAAGLRRREREWGCNGDAPAMPGWGHPAVECDPAFRSIRAGMGGVPILYRFTVAPKSSAQVVLGFCESHWKEPGKRPVRCQVEGAPAQEVECVTRWGTDQPGALLFNARDANGDGRLEVAVLPAAGAFDRNPILNALWIFPAGQPLDLKQVIAGRLSAAALRYVDVGGQQDQTLVDPDKVEYLVSLPPHGTQEASFLLACAGGAAPVPPQSAWTPDSLRRDAARVWADWLGQGARISLPDADVLARYRLALAHILLCRHQANGFFLPLARPAGPEAFDAAVFEELVGALDLAGQSAEAERCLRACCETPAPYAGLAQGKDGRWPGETAAQARLCLALGRHAALGAGRGWIGRARPAALAGAKALPALSPTGDDAVPAAQALLACTSLAEPARPKAQADAVTAEWLAAQAKALDARSARFSLPEPQNADARAVWTVRSALVRETDDGLLLLPAVPDPWLAGEGLSAAGLPTLYGPVSVAARRSDGKTTITAEVPAGAKGAFLCLPAAVATARVNGKQTPVTAGRVSLPCGERKAVVVTY